ncbi:MAG: SUF system Fe-S cluster assembly regulator [Fibrobacteres bacterium]|nr:SUF system Fe-S cluster assembly regulator [Fibrobacterota bacterium]
MIRLTKQADYGILLMTQFAKVGQGGMLSVSDLATRTGLSAPMVNKTVKLLSKAGLLNSSRGVHGGYQLSRGASAITLEEVIIAVEGPIALTECQEHTGGSECGLHASCPTRINWGIINHALRDSLAGITLLQMIHPLLGAPRAKRVESRT